MMSARGGQELRHDPVGHHQVLGRVLEVGPIQQRLEADRVPHARHVGGDGAVAEGDQHLGALPDDVDPLEVVLAGHGALHEADVHVLRELLVVHQRSVDKVRALEDVKQALVEVDQRHVTARAAVEPDRGDTRLGHSPRSSV
jgi:hypothetical protein